MEKELKIPLGKGKALYGRFDGSLRQSLFIVVHGLPGNIGEGFYERARQLIDGTLKTQASDLDAVVRYFKKRGVKRVYVAGHSYGGPTIFLSKEQKFDAAVLWDPSFEISFTREKYGFPGGKYVKALNGYFMKWGANVIIGKAMAKEADTLRWADLPKKFHVPLKILVAGKGVLVDGGKTYFENAHEPKDIEIIKGATHYFDDQEKTQEHVFELSRKWFHTF